MSSDTNLAGSAEEVFVSQISLTLARCRSSGNLASLAYSSVASAVYLLHNFVSNLASDIESRLLCLFLKRKGVSVVKHD